MRDGDLFGAGGDLTKRKLMPAIYNLARRANFFPSNSRLLAFRSSRIRRTNFASA